MNIPSFNTKALSETATALATNRTDDAQAVSFSFDANRTDDAQTQFRDVSFEATNGTNTTTENATTETAITDDAQTQFRDVSFEATNKTNTTTENATTGAAIQTRLETTQEEDGSQERIVETDDTDAFSSSISGRIDHILNELKITQRLGKKNNDNKQKKNVSEVITWTKYFAVYFLNLFIL